MSKVLKNSKNGTSVSVIHVGPTNRQVNNADKTQFKHKFNMKISIMSQFVPNFG